MFLHGLGQFQPFDIGGLIVNNVGIHGAAERLQRIMGRIWDYGGCY